MRKAGFILFFSVVLLIYAAINYYIIMRGLNLLSPGSLIRTVFLIAVLIAAAAFPLGRLLERIMINPLTSSLIWIGTFWLAFMVYFFLTFLLLDLLSGIGHLFGFIPDCISSNPAKTKEITGLIVITITTGIVIAGYINTWFPVVRRFNLTINKPGGKIGNVHIVVFSDIHLGTTIEKRHCRIIVNKVNALKPDIILIPGDIIDEDIAPVLKTNVGEVLKQLQSKYGVYAITGNHEYIGGVRKAKKYLNEHNIMLLNDKAELIDDSFYVAGREDLTMNQFTGIKRKELNEIIKNLDHSKPIILLDHQPFRLEQAERNGVDLQLSGHTHHGQLWPFNYITNMIFEVSRGYKQKGNTHYYISSGVGGWGPPIRTVNRPEIVSIQLMFNQK